MKEVERLLFPSCTDRFYVILDTVLRGLRQGGSWGGAVSDVWQIQTSHAMKDVVYDFKHSFTK